MSVSAGVDYSYTVSPGTSDVDGRAATIHATGATAVVAEWGLTSDTLKTDTVNLNADLSDVAASTPSASLTASLGQLLKGATHVDPTTGAREINQGVGQTLSGQIGQLLVGAGFSQTDATKASVSLTQQLTSTSLGSNILALSLSNNRQSAGTYTAAVAGGQEASAYSVHSTATLNIAFDARNGDLTVGLSEHKVAATRVEWSAATATNVSISLTQPELDAIGFSPTGTTRNQTHSPVQETVTTTNQSSGLSGIGSSNVAGPGALASYLGFEEQASASSSPLAGLVTQIGAADPLSTVSAKTLSDRADADAAVNALKTTIANARGPLLVPPPASNSISSSISPASLTETAPSKQTAAEAAVLALKKIVFEAQAAFANQSQLGSRSVSLSITQPIGTAIVDPSGSRSLLYTRPTGESAAFGISRISLRA